MNFIRVSILMLVSIVISGCNSHFNHSPTFLSGTLPNYAQIVAPVGLVVRPQTRTQTFNANPYLGYSATLATGNIIQQSIDASVRPMFLGAKTVSDPSASPLAVEVTYTDIVYNQPGVLGLQFQVETLVEFFQNGSSIAAQRNRSGKFPFSNQSITYDELERRLSASLSNATGASITSAMQSLLSDPKVIDALSEYASASEIQNLAALMGQATQGYVSNQSAMASGANAANSTFTQQIFGAVGGAFSGAVSSPSTAFGAGGGGQCDAQTVSKLRQFVSQRCRPGSRDHSCSEYEQLLKACGG